MVERFSTAAEALQDLLVDGMTLAVGGFGLCGIPADLIEAVRDSGVQDLTLVSSTLGIDGAGPGLLLEDGQVTRILASYVGENRLFAERYLAGEIEVEFTPQGTLAERLRAGGAGIPGFFTRTGVGTAIAEGKQHQEFDGETFILERGIVADVALVHAHTADACGNLVHRLTAGNFNPVVATCGRTTVVEAEHIVEPGEIAPDRVMTPSVFVQRLVPAAEREKPIERRTTHPRPEHERGGSDGLDP